MASDPGALAGEQCDHYTLIAEIARGGMGRVMHARDENLDREVALKLIHDQLAGRGDLVQRFIEEAQICSQLQHPGIVPIYYLGLRASGTPFFTMRLISGESFATILDRRRDPLEEQERHLDVFAQVCQTVAYAHSRRVVHRDLKPGNVMVGDFGEVQLVDWGLAKVLSEAADDTQDEDAEPSAATDLFTVRDEEGESALSMTGRAMGTPSYMPPEQAQGDLELVDRRSDVFALGGILCAILTGAPVYEGSSAECLEAARHGDQARARARLDACSAAPELIALAKQCLDPGRYGRPRDAAMVVDRLREFREQVEARIRRARDDLEAERRATRLVEESAAKASAGVERARASKERAQQSSQRARDSEAEAEEALAAYHRLADVQRLAELQVDAEDYWPALPEMITPLRDWIHQAEELLARRSVHRETLQELRAAAIAYTSADQERDRRTHPRAREFDELLLLRDERRSQVELLAAGVTDAPELRCPLEFRLEHTDNRARPGEPDLELTAVRLELEKFEERIAALDERLATRRSWRFAEAADQWQHDTLTTLVAALDTFANLPARLPNGLAEVRERLAFSSDIERRSLLAPAACRSWEEAQLAIQSNPAYSGLELRPQIGLLPLGADPTSGLLEFAHLASGEPPERDESGRLQLTPECGIVLVLIPGGAFVMGGRDEQATPFEQPPQDVSLAPFLLSKFLMTQAQWLRCTGANPSTHAPGVTWRHHTISLLHPVESISHVDATRVLERRALCLPTEAQWEYACRAGTTTAWWTGSDKHSLEGAANLADRCFSAMDATVPFEEWLDDGYPSHSPVGTFRPNPWGLHDVCGNLAEWCAEQAASYISPTRPGDGWRQGGDPDTAILRGGSRVSVASQARSSSRVKAGANQNQPYFGVRPARRLSAEPGGAG